MLEDFPQGILLVEQQRDPISKFDHGWWAKRSKFKFYNRNRSIPHAVIEIANELLQALWPETRCTSAVTHQERTRSSAHVCIMRVQ